MCWIKNPCRYQLTNWLTNQQLKQSSSYLGWLSLAALGLFLKNTPQLFCSIIKANLWEVWAVSWFSSAITGPERRGELCGLRSVARNVQLWSHQRSPPLPAWGGPSRSEPQQPDHFFRSDSGPAQSSPAHQFHVSRVGIYQIMNQTYFQAERSEREYKSNLISTICTVSPAMDTSIKRI